MGVMSLDFGRLRQRDSWQIREVLREEALESDCATLRRVRARRRLVRTWRVCSRRVCDDDERLVVRTVRGVCDDDERLVVRTVRGECATTTNATNDWVVQTVRGECEDDGLLEGGPKFSKRGHGIYYFLLHKWIDLAKSYKNH